MAGIALVVVPTNHVDDVFEKILSNYDKNAAADTSSGVLTDFVDHIQDGKQFIV